MAAEREKAKEQEQQQQAPGSQGDHPDEYAPSEVELCKSPTEFSGGAGPVQKTLGKAGFTHWWIRTPDMERGMGPEGGGVPGVAGAGGNPLKTTINDHKGRGNAPVSECHPASQPGWGDPRWEREDRACLQAEMQLGRPSGPWIPPVHDCHTVVKEALDQCRAEGDLPSGGLAEPHDMGGSEMDGPPDGGTE